MSGMLSTSREALIIRSDPTLAAYIAELHDTGHDATGSAESGSTIKVPVWPVADGRPANGRTCPPHSTTQS